MKMKLFLLPVFLCLVPIFSRGAGLTVSTESGLAHNITLTGSVASTNIDAKIGVKLGTNNATSFNQTLVNPVSARFSNIHTLGASYPDFYDDNSGLMLFTNASGNYMSLDLVGAPNDGELDFVGSGLVTLLSFDGIIQAPSFNFNVALNMNQDSAVIQDRFGTMILNGARGANFTTVSNTGIYYGNGSGLKSLVTVPSSGHTNIVMENSSGALILYDLAALLGLTGGGSGSVTSIGFTASSGHSVSPSTITTSGTFVETRNGDENIFGFGVTNVGFLKVDTNVQVGGSLLSGGITTTNGFTNLAATASSSAYWDANRKLASLPNPGSAAAWVQTNDGNGNLGYAQMLGAGALNANSHVRLNASTNIESSENASGYTNIVTVPADTSHTNVVMEKRDGSLITYDLATLLGNGSGGGSTPNGLVTNAASVDITVTNAGAITTIRSNSVITPSVVVGGATVLNNASNTLSGTTYLGTNIAPYITADSGSTTTYTTNTVYTAKPQRGFLVGSVMLNSGVSGVAQMLLFYTNNGVGYVLNMQQGAGVSAQEFFPFCVPLSTNATFQFSPALGTGASCFITNTYEWLQ